MTKETYEKAKILMDKIEAGTATNEEVNAYMQEDFAHFQKYCTD